MSEPKPPDRAAHDSEEPQLDSDGTLAQSTPDADAQQLQREPSGATDERAPGSDVRREPPGPSPSAPPAEPGEGTGAEPVKPALGLGDVLKDFDWDEELPPRAASAGASALVPEEPPEAPVQPEPGPAEPVARSEQDSPGDQPQSAAPDLGAPEQAASDVAPGRFPELEAVEAPDSRPPEQGPDAPAEPSGEAATAARAQVAGGPSQPAAPAPPSPRVEKRSASRPPRDRLPRTGAVPVPPFGQVLGQPVRLAALALPLWVVFAGSWLGAILIGGAAAYLLAGGLHPAEVSAPTPTAAQPRPSASSAELAAGHSVVDRAARGDTAALAQLEASPADARSVEETVALARGNQVLRSAELGKLGEKLRRQPSLVDQPETVDKLKSFIDDPRTAVDALQIVADLPGEIGPDLLYEIWTGTRVRNDATSLAEQLVYSQGVRGKASAALSVALDLRQAEECEQAREILPRVIEHGDRRSLRLLGRLASRHGCGPRKAADCYPCLRDGTKLATAIQAVKKRPGPKL